MHNGPDNVDFLIPADLIGSFNRTDCLYGDSSYEAKADSNDRFDNALRARVRGTF